MKKFRFTAFVYLLLTLIIGSCDQIGRDKLAVECEKKILTRLKSPSSFNLVSENVNSGKHSAVVKIDFDSDNAFGASLRGNGQCIFIRQLGASKEKVFYDLSMSGDKFPRALSFYELPILTVGLKPFNNQSATIHLLTVAELHGEAIKKLIAESPSDKFMCLNKVFSTSGELTPG